MKKRGTRACAPKTRRNTPVAEQEIMEYDDLTPLVRHYDNTNYARGEKNYSTQPPYQCLRRSQKIQIQEAIQTKKETTEDMMYLRALMVLVKKKSSRRSSRLSAFHSVIDQV